MRELYELKDKVMRELKDFSNKDLTAGSLDTVKNLSKTAYYLCELIEEEEDMGGYSNRYGYPMRGYSRRYMPHMNYDYREPHMRDENYSYHGSDIDMLREMMAKAPNEVIRQHYQNLINQMESM
ncbi:MAG: hypothetical protein J5517_05855 [Eubacterium sp.]|nr:hypothetical protein [Eubacterium sp.]